MKVVIAIDSFKGSLTSIEAANTIKNAIISVRPDYNVIAKPLADGGEGTLDALIDCLNAKKIEIYATNPQGKRQSCYYGYIESSKTAIIEVAAACGITLVSQKNPLTATTYGVGEMINHAINLGCRDFIIGLGGSATNDGGLGMLKALGFDFIDKNGNSVSEGAKDLDKIHTVQTNNCNPELKNCRFQIACDVSNPLCGKNGATYIYGPQKGVSNEYLEIIDNAMSNYAEKVSLAIGKDFSNSNGAGAAGGLGFAFLSFTNSKITSGIELILNAINLEKEIKDADYVITGEGCIDGQTAMGKAPIGIAKLAKKYNKKVIAFAGSIKKDAILCNEMGIDAFFSILNSITTLQEALDKNNAQQNLFLTAQQVFRLL